MSRVVVVGGGVIGTACAHYLERAGHAVTLLDKGAVGSGCSHANCGYVSPSHVLPLAVPGALRGTIATLFQKDSPLKVKLRFDPALLGWFFNFARCCTPAAMMDAAAGIHALLQSSRGLYSDLFKAEPLEAQWEERGLLFVLESAKAMHHLAETDKLLSDKFGVPAKRYDGEAVRELEPALRPGLAGGYYYPADAHLRPDMLMASWRKLLDSRGVAVRENCEFREFTTSGGTVTGVRTAAGDIPADHVVVAAGAWTPLLNSHLGVKVPIQPGKGYSMTVPKRHNDAKLPMIFEEHRVAVTPFADGFRIGSTMEFAGYDATMNRRRLELLRNAANHYLSDPPTAPAVEEWWGWRPMIYDGKPVIGPSPKYGNVLIAAGHCMLGLSMAPATGKLVAELVGGNTPHIDPAHYSATRF